MALKVIGAGLGRTGTMSLKLALERLGFGPCYHMAEVFPRAEAPGMWAAAADGAADWPRIFEGFQASVDWPGATFWRELTKAYPEAKVILSRRDPKAWFDSTQATIFNFKEGDLPTPFRTMLEKVVGRMFDQRLHDEAHCIEVFERHNAAVIEAVPKEQLLVYEVSQGWDPLCAFLGAEVPAEPMPKTNSTAEFQARTANSARARLPT